MDYLIIYLPYLTLALGIVFFKKADTATRILVILIAVSIITDAIAKYLGIRKMNNLFLFHIYTPIEGVLYLIFFKLVLKKYNRSYTWVIPAIFLMICLIDSLNSVPKSAFNDFSKSAESIILIMCSIVFYYRIYNSEPEVFIERNHHFWFVSGTFIYFSGALYTFLLSPLILNASSDTFFGSWIVHDLSAVMKNLAYIIGFTRISKI